MTASSIWDLDTPALLLAWPKCERNLARAADFVRNRTVRLRPHFKNHKCVELARRQLAVGGAVGITVAKLAEAEILVAHGFTDILIANQVVGEPKIERLARLNERATVRVAVDSEENARAIGQRGTKAAPLGVLVEVDIGMGRCGVVPDAAAAFVHRLSSVPGIRFDGFQAYEGHAIGIADPERRAEVAEAAMGLVLDVRRRLEGEGFAVGRVSGAGTSTYRVTGSLAGMDELQIGSYATMDWYYHGLVQGEFAIALSVLATVISAGPDRFVLDVGVKGIGDEMGPPRLKDYPRFTVPSFRSEEHCTVQAPGHRFRVGDKLELIPSHSCTTCNLHRQIIVHDDGRVVDHWPIEASGALG